MQIERSWLNEKLIEQIEELINHYYRTTEASRGIPPYDFDWQVYLSMQIADQLVVIVACEDGKLVGFALYVTLMAPHHKSLKVAECDTLAVHADHRNRGIAQAIYYEAEEELRKQGVKRVVNRFRTCYNVEPIFPRLGFWLEEMVFHKDIG